MRFLRWLCQTLADKPVEVAAGAVAAIAAASAVFVAVQANEISERQNEIAARELRPFITANQRTDPRSETAELVVANDGGPATGFRVSDLAILDVRYSADGVAPRRRSLPVHDYFTAQYPTGNSKRKITTLVGGSGNDKLLDELQADADVYAEKTGAALELELTVYVRVYFVDRFGDVRDDYLSVDPATGATNVGDSLGRRVFALEDDEVAVSLRSSRPADLVTAWRATKTRIDK